MGVKRTALHQGIRAGLLDKLRCGQVGLPEPERDQAFEPKTGVGNRPNLRFRQAFDSFSSLNAPLLFSLHLCHACDNSLSRLSQPVVCLNIEPFRAGRKAKFHWSNAQSWAMS